MASRSVWKGQLRLSLVSIPVEVHSARNSRGRVQFRQIHEPSGKPVYYQKVVNGVRPMDADDIMKGYETGDDEYVLIDPSEIDAIKLEIKRRWNWAVLHRSTLARNAPCPRRNSGGAFEIGPTKFGHPIKNPEANAGHCFLIFERARL